MILFVGKKILISGRS